jgi:hypothetical protein
MRVSSPTIATTIMTAGRDAHGQKHDAPELV